MSRTSRMRLFFLALALAFIATACGSSGAPNSYDDQPQEDGRSLVETNYVDGCIAARTPDGEVTAADEANVARICECGFESIKAELAFEDFQDLDDRLRNDLNILKNATPGSPEAIAVGLIADCITAR